MENFEATETKKKIKIGISDIVVIGILAVLLGFFIYLKVVDSELFLFGYAWNYTDIGNFFNALVSVFIFISWIGHPKSKKRTTCIILSIVLFALEVGLISFSAYENIKNTDDTKRIVLSDGNEVMLSERINYLKVFEKKFEYTYMDVYQINGFAIKKVGKIDETYFSNKCLSQDKYTYEYDEASKKLTIICEYGTYGDSVVKLKEEYDTGFWEEEFTLE